MNIKHPVIKLVIVIIIVAGALVYFYRDKFSCQEKSRIQQGLCSFAGGELGTRLSGIGFSQTYKTGCFPKKKTSDAGKACKNDADCQGYCLWLNGDVVWGNMTSTCSDFKKALPVCAVK